MPSAVVRRGTKRGDLADRMAVGNLEDAPPGFRVDVVTNTTETSARRNAPPEPLPVVHSKYPFSRFTKRLWQPSREAGLMLR